MEKKALRRTLAMTLPDVILGIVCFIIFWTKSTEGGKLQIIASQIYLLLKTFFSEIFFSSPLIFFRMLTINSNNY